MAYNAISTDNHLNEPPNAYLDRLPKHLEDTASRVLRGEDGADGWSMDLWPNSQKIIAEMTEGMDAATKHDILAGNAMRALNLS